MILNKPGRYIVARMGSMYWVEVEPNGVIHALDMHTLQRKGELLRAEMGGIMAVHGPLFEQKDLVGAGHFFRHTDLGHWHEVPPSSKSNDGVEILYHAPGWPTPSKVRRA